MHAQPYTAAYPRRVRPRSPDMIGMPPPLMIDDDAPHILVIDDDARIRELLGRYLTEKGFRVSMASDAEEAGRRLRTLTFDLLIVDVMMPGQNGVDFVSRLREAADDDTDKDVPVVMLTALGETEARIKGLAAGADDYLAKPFDPRELLLRVNAILKRTQRDDEPHIEQVVFGPYSFHITSREMKQGSEIVRLTEREREIMTLFAQNAGSVVPRHELVSADGPGAASAASERTVDVQINRLRRKIEPDPSNPTWLQTVRGVGYKLHIE